MRQQLFFAVIRMLQQIYHHEAQSVKNAGPPTTSDRPSITETTHVASSVPEISLPELHPSVVCLHLLLDMRRFT